jgi:hypothetical protein
MNKYTITRINAKKDYQGIDKFSLTLKGVFTDKLLGMKTIRTYYVTSYDANFKEGQEVEFDIKDYDIREFDFQIPDGEVIKLKALAIKGV